MAQAKQRPPKRKASQARTAPERPGPAGQAVAWVLTVGVVMAIGLGTLYLLHHRNEAPPPKRASSISAADQNAPKALVKAANAIGFHTVTEPGTGLLESQPASAAPGPSTPDLLKPGSTAPPFTLKTPQGATVSLSDFRGHPVLLEFFATWCPHCQAEAPHLRALANSLQPQGARFVSVNADSENAASVFAFHRYFGLPYPALLDPGHPPGSFTSQGGSGPVTSAYHLRAYPTFYVITPSGKVYWASDGEQPDALLREKILAAGQQS
jgi:peroxiredoxin